MRLRSIAVVGCVIFVSLLGCSTGLEKKEYIKWVRDYQNGLHTKKVFGNFNFDLQYHPADFIRLANTSFQIDNDSLQYFTLNINLTDPRISIVDYNVRKVFEKQERVYYLSYQFQKDIYLEENGDRLPCLLFHFEQAINQTNSKTFLLAFKNKYPDSGEAKLIIESGLFGSLPMKIKVSKTHPTLRKI
jgi:hypothetical protein